VHSCVCNVHGKVFTSNTLPMESILATLLLVSDTIDTFAEDRMYSDFHLSTLPSHPWLCKL
jgi:hypothetical protein